MDLAMAKIDETPSGANSNQKWCRDKNENFTQEEATADKKSSNSEAFHPCGGAEKCTSDQTKQTHDATERKNCVSTPCAH